VEQTKSTATELDTTPTSPTAIPDDRDIFDHNEIKAFSRVHDVQQRLAMDQRPPVHPEHSDSHVSDTEDGAGIVIGPKTTYRPYVPSMSVLKDGYHSPPTASPPTPTTRISSLNKPRPRPRARVQVQNNAGPMPTEECSTDVERSSKNR
jgi:hypothetical protein